MHHYTLPTSWLYSFLTNCSFGFGKICVDKHIQLRQVQKIQDQSNFIWFCIGCLLPCSDGEKEKLKLLTIAYFVEKVSWIWIRYLKLPAKCFRSCIRHFTNLSSRETLASKEWILGRTRKTLVNNVFWVRLRKNSVSSRGLEQIIQQCFFKRTPLRASFSIFVSANTIANRAKKSPTIYVVVVGMFFSTLMKTN